MAAKGHEINLWYEHKDKAELQIRIRILNNP